MQSTYLGGIYSEVAYGIAIYTTSNDFPKIAGGADPIFVGGSEAYVSRLTGSLMGKGGALIGLYRGSTGTWYLDLNGNRAWDGPGADAVIGWGGDPLDEPVVGTW